MELDSAPPDLTARGVLEGVKVVEFAQLIAGPMAGSFLADMGAEVVHVEDPRNGDPHRVTGRAKNGTHLWWKVTGRNKRSVTLDLRTSAGQDLARRLAGWADVVITNFRADTLESWGLDWDSLHAVNPKLIVLQISGFGSNTTLRNRPGFGKVGEAMSGVVHLTGFPEGPPVHTGFSHADSVTGLYGAFAISAALNRRNVDPDFDGEFIDVALFEALYRICEWQIIFCDQLGIPAERAGNKLENAPAAVINTYMSGDGQWITVTSATTRSVRNVAKLLGQDLVDYETPEQQREMAPRLDKLLAEYIAARPSAEVLDAMAGAEVVASRIYSAQDILDDETYRERGAIITIDDPDLGPVRMQNALPKMHRHPGTIWRTGPALGQDNGYVYGDLLNMSDSEIGALHDTGVI